MTRDTELQSYLTKLCCADVHPEVMDLYDILIDPKSLLGHSIVQQWADKENTPEWFEASIDNYITETNEFKISFIETNEDIFMTVGEVITDIVKGHIEIRH